MVFILDRVTFSDLISGKLCSIGLHPYHDYDEECNLVYLDEFKYSSHYMLFKCKDRVLLFQVLPKDDSNYILIEILERSPLYDFVMEFYYS